MQTEWTGIWKHESNAEALLNRAAFQATDQKHSPEAVRSLMEDEAHVLTCDDVPHVVHRSICTMHAIESFVSTARQRTDQIDTLTTETSGLTIVWAVMQDRRLPKSRSVRHPGVMEKDHQAASNGWFIWPNRLVFMMGGVAPT